MNLAVEPSGQACGARVTGLDLTQSISDELAAGIRSAWLRHKVLAFPGQALDHDALERFALAMGGFGEDPFFRPIPGRSHIAAIRREADETTPLFAENWHSDWSFLPRPPAGTCLMAVDIPPVGGDTLFVNQTAAFAALPEERKDSLRQLTAIHSAGAAYAPDGAYGVNDKGRSMDIRPDESARQTQAHPLVKRHPETGEETLFSCIGYIIGIEGMGDAQARELLLELLQWQTQDRFIYRHRWQPDMLLLWDNRCVLHRATGGYEGHRRELHRITIAASADR